MKNLILIYFFFFYLVGISQNFESKDWVLLEYNHEKHFTVTKETQKFSIDEFRFEIIWDEKLSYSSNIGYYGGIKSLKIYKNNQLLNTFENIEDILALEEINFNFYDFNFDGYMDISLPIDAGKEIWYQYFLFDKTQNKFIHLNDWDYIRIQKMNKKTKQILTQPSGTAIDGIQELYQVSGLNLILLKTFEY